MFHRHLADRRIRDSSGPPSVIEGIGRLRCEPSFIPELIDRAYAVPDAAKHRRRAGVLSRRIGRSCGGSAGANMWAAARIVGEMAARGEQGRWRHCYAATPGERYRGTLLDDAWLAHRGIDIRPARDRLERFFDSGALD